jgi:hypothetical protein
LKTGWCSLSRATAQFLCSTASPPLPESQPQNLTKMNRQDAKDAKKYKEEWPILFSLLAPLASWRF